MLLPDVGPASRARDTDKLIARHFLDLAGAATLETESYLLAQRGRHVIDAGAMAVLHGDAGLGKTLAVEDALAAPQLPLQWMSFPSRPTPRLIAATLLETLTDPAGPVRDHRPARNSSLTGRRSSCRWPRPGVPILRPSSGALAPPDPAATQSRPASRSARVSTKS